MTTEREQKKRKLHAELAEIQAEEQKEVVNATIDSLNYGAEYDDLRGLTRLQLRQKLEDAKDRVIKIRTIIEEAFLGGKRLECTCGRTTPMCMYCCEHNFDR